MSVEEMKRHLKEKLDSLSPEQLEVVDNFIDRINKLPGKEYDLMPHIENIVAEREEVLKKLAQ